MSTTLTVHCDRCGCEIIYDRTAFDGRCGPLRSRRQSLDRGAAGLHRLLEWLGAGRTARGAPSGT